MILNDNKIIFSSKKEIKNNYAKLSISKNGTHSNIYKYNENEIMKILNNNVTIEQLEVMNILKNYESDLFSKPYLLVEIKNKIKGYTMKHLDGQSLNNISETVVLEDMFNFFDDNVEKRLYKLCQDKLKMWDMNYNNVLYDEVKNQFHFIDTDCYKYDKSKSEEEIYIFNNSEIISVIIEMMFYRNINQKKFIKFSKKELENGKKLKVILYEIKEYLENRYNKKIVTLNDLNNTEEITLKKYYY